MPKIARIKRLPADGYDVECGDIYYAENLRTGLSIPAVIIKAEGSGFHYEADEGTKGFVYFTDGEAIDMQSDNNGGGKKNMRSKNMLLIAKRKGSLELLIAPELLKKQPIVSIIANAERIERENFERMKKMLNAYVYLPWRE